MLVEGAEAWRWIVCVAIATAAAGELILMRERRGARRLPGAIFACGLFFATFFGGLAAIGIPVSYLVPGGWDDLENELARGLSGVSQVDTPYAGSDTWTRLGILAAVPITVSFAMLFAFWPAGTRRTGRAIGLDSPRRPLRDVGDLGGPERGACPWRAPVPLRWRGRVASSRFDAAGLPRRGLARSGDLGRAAPRCPRGRFRSAHLVYDWRVFGDEEEISFNWNHTYGPLDWPQDGTEVFRAEAELPTYWKTYVLDEFNGYAWTRSHEEFGKFGEEYELAGASDELVAAHPGVVPELRGRG